MFKIQKKTVGVGKMVGTDHVNSVIRNYKQERWAHNSKRIGKEDSLSVWYSIEELESFFIKCKEHGADGIKVYFGVYGETDAPKPLYAGRQTVVFVATKEKDSEKGSVNKDVYITTDEGASILAYNVGNMCPPFCTNEDGKGLGITIVDKGKDGLIIT